MGIVSSIIASVSPQRDDRRWVQEIHTDQLGVQYVRHWLAGVADDLVAALAARALQITADLTASEIAANIAKILALGSVASVTFAYSTAAANRTALRQAYLSASQQDAIMIGDFLSSLTDAQLQAAFSMTAGQVTTLRATKLSPAASAAATIRASTGA